MRTLLALASLLLALPASAMNFVVVIMDDVGAERISDYSGTYTHVGPTTTNVDALATAGIRFDRFSSEPNCSPTRTSLFTGRHPFRHGVGTALNTQPNTAGSTGLAESEQNIAKVLKANGYRTSAVGKWHMCGGNDDCGPGSLQPYRVGFDYAYISGAGEGGYYNQEFCEQGVCVLGSAAYSMTEIANRAIADINAGDSDEPYFVWLAPINAHGALAVETCPPDALTPTYNATCDPLGGEGATSAFTNAAIEAMDTELDRVFDEIDFSDTCVILIGDNGTANSATEAPYVFGHNKSTVYQQGIRTPLIVAGDCVEASEANTVGTQSIHVTDLAATILHLAGLSAGVADGTYEITDGISIVPYLVESSTASIRQTTLSEHYFPTGLPYVSAQKTTLDRRSEHQHYARLRFTNGTEQFFENIFTTDITEQTALNVGALTAAQQVAYDLLEDSVTAPDNGPTPIRTWRSLADAP